MSDGAALQQLCFQVSVHVSRPVAVAYAAVAEPDQLSQYFTTGGARGVLATGETVRWDFHDFPGRFDVMVREAVPSTRIVLEWPADVAATIDPLNTVTFTFEPIDDDSRTRITVSESAWHVSAEGARGAFGNCEGWTGMLAALKAWLEHGINLREGFYR